MKNKVTVDPATLSDKEILEAFRAAAAEAMKDPAAFYRKSKLTDEYGNFKSCA